MDNIFKGVIIDKKVDTSNYKVSQFVPNKDKIKDEQFSLRFPTKEIILDQGQWNSCVGHSYALAKSILEYAHTNKWIDFDPFYIYGTRYEGGYVGEGMTPDQGAKVLYKEGAVLRRDFGIKQEMPMIMDTVKDWKVKHFDKVRKALNYTITGYAYANSIESIKKALKNGMPVSCCYPIYDSFYDTPNNGMVPRINPSKENIIGYHQMLIVGWTSDRWIVCNSWGTNLGLKGMYLIPFSNPIESAIAVSDSITPSLRKSNKIVLTIGSLNYTIDDKEAKLDTAPYIKNDRTYLPIRSVTESLGCSVEWKQDTKKILIHSEEANIEMTIGSNLIVVNGDVYKIDVAPEIVNNRTMVPVRFISEFLNCKVDWNPETRQVTIKSL